MVVNAPIGYRDSLADPVRQCDAEARVLLAHRGIFLHNAPTWETISRGRSVPEDGLDAVTAMLLPLYLQVAKEMFPYRQRVVYQGNPELSFFLLNDLTPLARSKNIMDGREERQMILLKKVPGIEKIINSELDGVPLRSLLDASAMAWSARRVFARAAKRIPAEGQWDTRGLRMEYVY